MFHILLYILVCIGSFYVGYKCGETNNDITFENWCQEKEEKNEQKNR